MITDPERSQQNFWEESISVESFLRDSMSKEKRSKCGPTTSFLLDNLAFQFSPLLTELWTITKLCTNTQEAKSSAFSTDLIKCLFLIDLFKILLFFGFFRNFFFYVIFVNFLRNFVQSKKSVFVDVFLVLCQIQYQRWVCFVKFFPQHNSSFSNVKIWMG